jgi:hypothetical protein
MFNPSLDHTREKEKDRLYSEIMLYMDNQTGFLPRRIQKSIRESFIKLYLKGSTYEEVSRLHAELLGYLKSLWWIGKPGIENRF